MVRIPFLVPTRKNLSGIEPPTKAFGRDLDKKTLFEDFHIQIFFWKKTFEFQFSG